MAKMKTHRGAAKRFKVTGTGSIAHTRVIFWRRNLLSASVN